MNESEIPKKVHEMALEIARLQVLVVERDKALTIQAREYERRLETLNHAHEQQVERNSFYVSHEIWDAFKRSNDVRFDSTADANNKRAEAFDLRVKELENWRSRSTGMILGAMAVIGAIGGAVGAFLMRLFKQ